MHCVQEQRDAILCDAMNDQVVADGTVKLRMAGCKSRSRARPRYGCFASNQKVDDVLDFPGRDIDIPALFGNVQPDIAVLLAMINQTMYQP